MKILNKKALHNYHILEKIEAGIQLTGSEVKSIRASRVDLSESFARIENNQIYLKNAHIYPLASGIINQTSIDRKLLLHRSQINSIIGKLSRSHVTLIPLSLYTTHNLIKVELALAESKNKFDKRKAIKAKDEQRKLEQEMKGIKF